MRRRPLSVWKGAAKTPATDDEDGECVEDENDDDDGKDENTEG